MLGFRIPNIATSANVDTPGGITLAVKIPFKTVDIDRINYDSAALLH